MEQLSGDVITKQQRIALDATQEFNLSDGHPRRSFFPAEEEVISRVPALYDLANISSVVDIEQVLVTQYGAFSEQTISTERSFVFPSASIAITAAAMVVRRAMKNSEVAPRVQALNPTFDNLPGLFSAVGSAVTALPEATLRDRLSEGQTVLNNRPTDALLLVSPNNPTGQTLTETELSTIAAECKAMGTTLVFDAAFRLFKPDDMFDTAKVLDESGVSYLLINDTGKLWALHENKAGIVTASEDLREATAKTHNTLQVSSSAVTMLILTELMALGGDLPQIRSLVTENREVLKDAVSLAANSALVYPQHENGLPVELIALAPGLKYDSHFVADAMKKALRVHAVPLTDFYLPSTDTTDLENQAAVRIALSRDRDQFQRAAEQLARLTQSVLEAFDGTMA